MTGWVDKLLHLHDTPRRTAAAFALGVFFSFSPFIGFQILASMGLAFLLRLNRLAVFLGLNTNLPWFMAPWYAATTVAAAALLGFTLPPDVGGEIGLLFQRSVFTREFWSHAGGLVRPFLVPFLIGPTVGAALVAAVAYPVTHAFLRRRLETRTTSLAEP